MDPDYVIRAARDEESNSGWIWIGGPSQNNPKSRHVVKITREGRGRGLYVDARVIDDNFIDNYKSNPRRCPIEFTNDAVVHDTIVMGDWYRRALGIRDSTPCDEKSGKIKLHVEEVEFCGCATLFAACHSPDATVRLATRLGTLGVGLGVLALADPLLKVGEHIAKHDGRLQWLKDDLPASWTTEYLHSWAMIIVALLLAFLVYFLCRGRPGPPLA